MDTISEARLIQKEIQDYKREIILLEKELKKNLFEESYQTKLEAQEKLRQEVINLNQELQNLKQEISSIKYNQEESEKEEINSLVAQIEALKKENSHLCAQEEQLKKSEQLLDLNQQNYVYGVYLRRLGPTERENADLTKKIKKCEEDIEKLKVKCDKVKHRYPSSFIEKLKFVQERQFEVHSREKSIKDEISIVESEIKEIKDIPKQDPQEILKNIADISNFIEKERLRSLKIEKKIKEKQQELKLARYTVPKNNGSHGLYKEIELLSLILVDKVKELNGITNIIDEMQSKINSLTI